MNKFEKDYTELSHLQSKVNDKTLDALVLDIQRWFPNTSHTPLHILDLCCGHGKPAFDLLQKLESKNIQVAEIRGYDLSEDLIEEANRVYGHIEKLKYMVKDVFEIDNDLGKYDLVICFFGLHWIKDIQKLAELIAKSLKKEGKIIFVVPFEKWDLLEWRRKGLLKRPYDLFLKGFQIEPVVGDPKVYRDAFDKYFEPDESTRDFYLEFSMTRLEFEQFLSSIIPELRYLKGEVDRCDWDNELKKRVKENYVVDLVDSIPVLTEGNVRKQPACDRIDYTSYCLKYQATVKSLTSKL